MIPDKTFYENYALKYPDDLVIRGSQLACVKEYMRFKGKVGLDIGSANGALAIEIAKLGAKHIHGIDLAEQFITQSTAHAKVQKCKNVTFKQADAKKLPYKDNEFDFVLCTEVLEHVPDFKIAIEEIKRVLKPNGQFLVTVPNSLCPAEIAHQAKHIIMWLLRGEAITHINIFLLPTVKKHFKWAKSVKVIPLHFVLPFLPKRFVSHEMVNLDLLLGRTLKPFAFDTVIIGKK